MRMWPTIVIGLLLRGLTQPAGVKWRGPKGRGKPRKRGWDLGAPVSPTLKVGLRKRGWTTEKGFRTVTEVPGYIHNVAPRREPPAGPDPALKKLCENGPCDHFD